MYLHIAFSPPSRYLQYQTSKVVTCCILFFQCSGSFQIKMERLTVILFATRILISHSREQIFFTSSEYEDGKSNYRNPRVKTIWFEPKYDDSSDISDRRIETSRYSESPDRDSRSSSVDSFRKSTYSESPEKRIRRFESSSSSRSSESPRGNSNRQARFG